MSDIENEGAADTTEASNDQSQADLESQTEDQKQEDTTDEKGGDLLADDVDKKSTDEKSDDDKSEEDADKKDEDGKVEYEEFNIAEGVTVDEDLLGGARELFSEFGLSQEQAQKLIDLYAGNIETATKAQEALVVETQKSWLKELKDDPDFGGQNFEKNSMRAGKAFKKFADDETVQFMKDTGLGKHPVFMKMFYRIAEHTLEDEMSDGDVHEQKDITERWYPKK